MWADAVNFLRLRAPCEHMLCIVCVWELRESRCCELFAIESSVWSDAVFCLRLRAPWEQKLLIFRLGAPCRQLLLRVPCEQLGWACPFAMADHINVHISSTPPWGVEIVHTPKRGWLSKPPSLSRFYTLARYSQLCVDINKHLASYGNHLVDVVKINNIRMPKYDFEM